MDWWFLFAEKVADFPDIMRPSSIVVDGNEFYVIENTRKISVYSLSNNRFLRDIANRGEGPGEFRHNPP